MDQSTSRKISEWNAYKLRQSVNGVFMESEDEIILSYLRQWSHPLKSVKRAELISHFIRKSGFFSKSDWDAASVIVSKTLARLKKDELVTNGGKYGYWELS